MIVSDRVCKDVTTADGMPMEKRPGRKSAREILDFSSALWRCSGGARLMQPLGLHSSVILLISTQVSAYTSLDSYRIYRLRVTVVCHLAVMVAMVHAKITRLVVPALSP